MNDHDRILRDLDPDADRLEADQLAGVGARLLRERGQPAAAFSARLARRLGASDRPALGLALAYALSGSALLAVAALGAAGAGPLAP
jgi:hypothetical protein